MGRKTMNHDEKMSALAAIMPITQQEKAVPICLPMPQDATIGGLPLEAGEIIFLLECIITDRCEVSLKHNQEVQTGTTRPRWGPADRTIKYEDVIWLALCWTTDRRTLPAQDVLFLWPLNELLRFKSMPGGAQEYVQEYIRLIRTTFCTLKN